MKQKETMKQTKQTTSENQFNQLHSKDFGLLGVVTNVKDAEDSSVSVTFAVFWTCRRRRCNRDLTAIFTWS